MCTSLSHRQDYESAGVWFHGDGSVGGAFDEGEEPGAESLQQLVLDLRSQLTRCHKVIRGLQLRVRSLSTTSDYASSLERTPRKVLHIHTGLGRLLSKCNLLQVLITCPKLESVT